MAARRTLCRSARLENVPMIGYGSGALWCCIRHLGQMRQTKWRANPKEPEAESERGFGDAKVQVGGRGHGLSAVLPFPSVARG